MSRFPLIILLLTFKVMRGIRLCQGDIYLPLARLTCMISQLATSFYLHIELSKVRGSIILLMIMTSSNNKMKRKITKKEFAINKLYDIRVVKNILHHSKMYYIDLQSMFKWRLQSSSFNKLFVLILNVQMIVWFYCVIKFKKSL